MSKKKFLCQLTTRYAETDQMGVIHHGTYATYFELARIEWLRSLGLSYSKLETQEFYYQYYHFQQNSNILFILKIKSKSKFV